MLPEKTDDIVEYLALTKPHLLQAMIKKANPALDELIQTCNKVQFGTLELTITLRAGEIAGIDFIEKRKWKPPLDPKSKG